MNINKSHFYEHNLHQISHQLMTPRGRRRGSVATEQLIVTMEMGRWRREDRRVGGGAGEIEIHLENTLELTRL